MGSARQRRAQDATGTVRSTTRRARIPLALLALAVITGASSASALAASNEPAASGDTRMSLFELLEEGPYAYPQMPNQYGQVVQVAGTPGLVAPLSPATIAPTLTPAAPKPAGNPGLSSAEAANQLAANGIPVVALRAYRDAEKTLAKQLPACGLSWSLLAGIGRVESNHGQFAGATLLADGRSDPPVRGPMLDGNGFATITDTDGGRLDGDARYDRAIGPMQFIPGTWVRFAVDGDGDHAADPYDIDDAALAAGYYLCRAGGNLRLPQGRHDAVFAYNHSEDYVRLVLDLADAYARGVRVDKLPGRPVGAPAPHPVHGPLPPATVGPPPGVPPEIAAGLPPTGSPTAPTSPPASTPPGTTPPGTTPPGSEPPTSTPPGSEPPTSPTDPPTSPTTPPESTPPSDPPTTCPDPGPGTSAPPTPTPTPSGESPSSSAPGSAAPSSAPADETAGADAPADGTSPADDPTPTPTPSC
jgi:membrane-bound lytic murein transglycosylase B